MIRVDPRDPLEINFFFTQNTRKSRKPCGTKMLSYEGIRGGARYTCATIRMASTNKVCALPRILRIPREIFLPDSNFFFCPRILLTPFRTMLADAVDRAINSCYNQ